MASTQAITGQPKATAPLKASKQRISLVVILLITITIAYFDRVNVSILAANDTFLREMGIKGHPVQIGLLMTLFLVAYGIANVGLSPLGDILGPRKAMAGAVGLWAISMVLGGLVASFTLMLASRIILGVGEGMHYPMQSKYVKKWFPPQERGRANALWIIGASLAPATAMPVFTWMIQSYGWRFSFFACAILGLLPLYLVWFHTTDTPREHKKVNALELRHIEEALAKEAKALDTPAKDDFWANVRLVIRNYRFWLLVIYYSCMLSIFWGLLSWLPSYLKSARGFSWTQMGMLSSLPFVLAVAAKALTGWLSDRIGRSAPFCVIAMLGTAAGIYFGATVSNHLASALLIAFGGGALSLGTPAAWTLLQGLVPNKAVSLSAGGMNGIANAFSSSSPVVIGFFISLTGSYAGGLFYLVALALLAAAATSVLAIQKY
jgi:sugar phosphate permease